MTTSISTMVPPSSTILSKDVSEAKSASKSSSNKHPNPSSDSTQTSTSHSGSKNNGQKSQFTSSKPNPFRDAFMAKVEKIEYEITNVRSKINDIQASINEVTSGGKSGSGSLIDELREKKTRLFALIEAKTKANESMKQIRSEVDIKVKLLSECMTTERSIVDLERRLESGNVKIVDERKLITEISRLKKTHVPYETLQRDIEAFETTLETYRASRDSAGIQIDALKEEIDQIQSALKLLTSQKENKQGQLTELHDKKKELKTKMTSLIEEKQVLYNNFKKAQEERRKVYERTMQRKEKQAEKEVIQNDIDALEEKISKLELTADQDVESCDSLVVLLNSLFATESSNESSEKQASETSATASRKPEAPKDLVLLRRGDDADFLACTSSGKKSSKHQARISKKSASDSSFKLPMNVVSGFGALGVPLPLNVNEVPQAIENLRKKREELSSKSEERKRVIANQKEGITEQINELKLKIAAMDAEIANIK